MTLGISSLSSVRNVADYFFWNISEYNSPPLADPEQPYYLYARCSKSNNAGTFLLSADAIAMEEEAGYYHFLVGVLNSQNEDGDRSYVDLYGYTEILPGRITVNKIVSQSGQMYIDLEAGGGVGEIGGIIRFRNAGGDYKNVDDIDYDDVGADPSGTAASEASSAESSANSFATGLFNSLDSLKLDAIVNGQTIIAGGYINTNLIETNGIYVNSSNVNGLGNLALLDSLGFADVGADPAGAAASARISANTYTQGLVNNLTYNDVGADPSGAAASAQASANLFSQGLVNNINAADVGADPAGTAVGYYNSLNAAKQDAVVNGQTLIVGGYIRSNFIDTDNIHALGNVTAGSFNLGNGNFIVDANGHLTAVGANIKSSSTGDRIEISSSLNALEFVDTDGWARISISRISGKPTIMMVDSTGFYRMIMTERSLSLTKAFGGTITSFSPDLAWLGQSVVKIPILASRTSLHNAASLWIDMATGQIFRHV